MSRNAAGWIVAAALLYVAFLLAQFPAATAYRWFAPDAVRLLGIDGTFWSGRANLGSVAGLSLHDLTWELYPSRLLTGRIALRVESRVADGFVNSNISVSPLATRLSELQASASLPAIEALLPPPLRSTRGSISAELEMLELRNGWVVDAGGQVRIARLAVPPLLSASSTPSLIPLGDYRVLFVPTDGEGVRAELQDQGGPLEVSGALRLDVEGNYALEGFVRARPEASAELVQGLELMTGDPDASGRRLFDLSGSFRRR
jgi:general secretion pathway protein N